ncbi:MAG: hypothetical protein V7K98_23570 [Nostoc sp.]|uniref:hypothetical protein n=1 Tax=Nostoc sp. TaxID=1180 RepID=UPI002FF53C51
MPHPLVGKIFKVMRLDILFGTCSKVAAGATETLKNACGEPVRPEVIQAGICEAGIA